MSAVPAFSFAPALELRSARDERVKAALDVWASLLHHRAAGGGGWPPLGECLEKISDPQPLVLTRRVIEKEFDEGMAATRVHAVEDICDHRTLLVAAGVHASLEKRECPQFLKAFLLLKHPRQGKFQPERSLAGEGELEAARQFVEKWPEGRAMVGRLTSSRTEADAARLVRSLYLRLVTDLEDDLAGF